MRGAILHSPNTPSWHGVQLKKSTLAASQEIPRLLWNPKVHYRVYKGPQLIPILSQMNPVHTLPLYFPEIHSVIIFSSMSTSCKTSLSFRFSSKNIVCIPHPLSVVFVIIIIIIIIKSFRNEE
jgi:hypothetical protein